MKKLIALMAIVFAFTTIPAHAQESASKAIWTAAGDTLNNAASKAHVVTIKGDMSNVTFGCTYTTVSGTTAGWLVRSGSYDPVLGFTPIDSTALINGGTPKAKEYYTNAYTYWKYSIVQSGTSQTIYFPWVVYRPRKQ